MILNFKNGILLACLFLFLGYRTNYKNYHSKSDQEKEIILRNAVKKGKNFTPQRIYFANRDYLEFDGSGNFPSIGIQIQEKRGPSTSTYFEIKKRGKIYIDNDGKEYESVEKALEMQLKDKIYRFYDKEKADYIWENFVKDGDLEKFIKTCKEEIIDYDFLHAPFNDLYG
ncbi:MAG: hypothetical protein Q4B43_01765 [Bacteroidota bacterium]|nr:hypothetical protein [Bacteroidota bacterium]